MLTELSSLLLYVIAAAIASIFLLAWVIVLSLRAPKKTVPKSTVVFSLVAGVISAFLAVVIERVVYSANVGLEIFNPSFSAGNLTDLINAAIFSFLFVAIVEEGIKFLILKQYLKKNDINQVVDGMKIGFILGLGFALVENSIYFVNFYAELGQSALLIKTVVLRGVLSTLAHGLYGLLMGYFIVMARFHASRRARFLWQAILIGILIHGLFDFMLIINLGIFSVIALIVILAIIIVWYGQRRNLELYLPITIGGEKISAPTFLADRSELEVFLSKNAPPKKDSPLTTNRDTVNGDDINN